MTHRVEEGCRPERIREIPPAIYPVVSSVLVKEWPGLLKNLPPSCGEFRSFQHRFRAHSFTPLFSYYDEIIAFNNQSPDEPPIFRVGQWVELQWGGSEFALAVTWWSRCCYCSFGFLVSVAGAELYALSHPISSKLSLSNFR